MAAAGAKTQAKEVADSRWVEGAGRLGLVAKGVSFALVALLALQVAFSGRGHTEDRQGALRAVAQEPLGRWSLIVLALGFAGYAAWRLAQAVFDRDREGHEAKGLAKRGGHLAKAALYGTLCATTLTIVVDARSGGSGNEEDKWTARILDVPLGRWVVLGGGLAILGVGIFNAYESFTGKFRDDLRTHRMGRAEDRSYTVLGIVGHAARGVVFGVIGVFVARAAWQYDPKESVGLDGALAKVAAQEYGHLLLGLVALGLLAYAAFCFVEARYREV